MALLRNISILSASYLLVVLLSMAVVREPHWGGCFLLLVWAEFSRLFTVWFNFALRGK